MDAIKCVVGRKQKQLRDKPKGKFKQASDYYKIWSINGYRGQQKFRGHYNFDNTYDFRFNEHNTFLFHESVEYVEGLVGKVNQLGKLYSWGLKSLNEIVTRVVSSQNWEDVHP